MWQRSTLQASGNDIFVHQTGADCKKSNRDDETMDLHDGWRTSGWGSRSSVSQSALDHLLLWQKQEATAARRWTWRNTGSHGRAAAATAGWWVMAALSERPGKDSASCLPAWLWQEFRAASTPISCFNTRAHIQYVRARAYTHTHTLVHAPRGWCFYVAHNTWGVYTLMLIYAHGCSEF